MKTFLGVKVDDDPIEKFFKKGYKNNPLWWKIPCPDGIYRFDKLSEHQSNAPDDYVTKFSGHHFIHRYAYWCSENNDFPTHYSIIERIDDHSTIAFWKLTSCRQCGKELFDHSSTFIFTERMRVKLIFDDFFSDRFGEFNFNWPKNLQTEMIRDDDMFTTNKHISRYGNIDDHSICCNCLTSNMRAENRAKIAEQTRKENSIFCRIWKSFFPEESE